MGFYFIVIVPLLPSHCGFSFVFGCEVSFLVSSSVFQLMIVQQLVVIPVLSQEGVGIFEIINEEVEESFHYQQNVCNPPEVSSSSRTLA